MLEENKRMGAGVRTYGARKVRVVGRVQRIGYRRYVLDTAQELGISGYLKNEKDGSVSVFAQGEEAQLAQFPDRIRSPPQPISVNRFGEEAADPNPRLKFFAIRFGSVAEELQEGFGAMEKEFRDYRDEFKDYRVEFRDYREEFRDYRQEFRSLAERTDNNFKVLEDKYGEISAKLTQVLETLQKESMDTRKEMTRAIDTLSELVRQFVERQRPSDSA